MATIPDDFHDILAGKAFAHFATKMPDGNLHVTPVWVSYDGEHVLINTAKGRQKDVNVRRDPKVGVSILDPDDPYRYLSIQGEVVEITQEGAIDHIDELAQKYMGVEEYPNHGDEMGPREIIRIRPDSVITSG